MEVLEKKSSVYKLLLFCFTLRTHHFIKKETGVDKEEIEKEEEKEDSIQKK